MGTYAYDYAGRRTELNIGEDNGTEITITGVLRLKEGLNYGCLGNGGLYFTEQLYHEFLEKNTNSSIANFLKIQSVKVQEFNAIFQLMSKLDKNTPEYAQASRAFGEFLTNVDNLQYFKRAASTLKDNYMSGESMAKGDDEDGASVNPILEQLKSWYFLYGDTALRSVGALKTVSGIYIYARNFDAKESILSHLDAWNDTHSVDEQVKYTDTVGMMMSMVETILDAITYVLVAFTAISLVVSSVMIGIITYVSVVERVKEIGVLRSLGARKRDIKNLFNAETFIIGLASGVFGVAVTYLLSIGINALLGYLTGIATLANLPVSSAIIMVVISVTLTLISGLIPAKAAAKKDPVVALRTE